MRQLTALDAQFLALESSRIYGHVSGLAVYESNNTLTLERLQALIDERLHLLPPFRWRLAEVPFGLDHPYWIEDPDFDLEYHVRELALPAPGDDAQLADQVARIVSRPLDRSRPLWELYLIHGLERDRSAVLTKIHHAAVDGVSGAEVLSVLLDREPEGREVTPPERRRPERAPSQWEMLGRGVLGLPRQPWRAARALPVTLANLDDVPFVNALPGTGAVSGLARTVTGGRDRRVLERPTTQAPRTRFNGRVSAHRRFAFGRLSLPAVKEVKNALGITVNDVVVGLCASALRTWLLERGELPDECLVAMVPVSVRSSEQAGTFGNRVSAMVVPVPTVEPEPRRRLERTHEILRAAKERHRAVPAQLLQDVTQFIPPAVHARASRLTTELAAAGPFRPALNVVISNVPGPSMPLYLAGARLCAHYPVSVVADGVGLNITVMSYRDDLDVGIVCDREQMEDPWALVTGMRAALEEFCALAADERATRAPV
jgi:diacylglycerol O-acyltransferase / wax synthase